MSAYPKHRGTDSSITCNSRGIRHYIPWLTNRRVTRTRASTCYCKLISYTRGRLTAAKKISIMCSVIPRRCSWGQLCLTQEACQRILFHQRVFTPFLDVIHAFGFKTNDDLPGPYATYNYVCTGLEGGRTPYLYGERRLWAIWIHN